MGIEGRVHDSGCKIANFYKALFKGSFIITVITMGGGFKYVIFSPLLGEMIQLVKLFKWLGSTKDNHAPFIRAWYWGG